MLPGVFFVRKSISRDKLIDMGVSVGYYHIRKLESEPSAASQFFNIRGLRFQSVESF